MTLDGAARGPAGPHAAPVPPRGRAVASASERKADAQARGNRRPEREPQRSAAAGHVPARTSLELPIKFNFPISNHGNSPQSENHFRSRVVPARHIRSRAILGPGLLIIESNEDRVVEESFDFAVVTGSSGNRCLSLRSRFISAPYRKQNLRIVAADTLIPFPFNVVAMFS